jgi:DNA-binding phage protein
MATETRKFYNVLKDLMERAGVKSSNYSAMARHLGMTPQGAKKTLVEDMNPSISRAIDYLDTLGMTLAVVPKETDLPEGCTRLCKTVDKREASVKAREAAGAANRARAAQMAEGGAE